MGSSITVQISNLPSLFEAEREEQIEEIQDFIRDILPDLKPQVKGFILSLLATICFNCDYFIDNYHPRKKFLLF